ncbi:MAG: DNA-directed RNA polymerase subunit A' [Candidatus Woesearchaeota archaeon]
MSEEYVYKSIKSIQFGVLSPKMIKEMSSAKVVTPELYDKEGYPVDGGLMDIRLGVIDPGLRCKTCGQRVKDCPGHFGHIELARPVVHIKFVPLLLSILRSTCQDCGRILLPENKLEEYKVVLDQAEQEGGLDKRRAKLKELIAAEKSGSKCPHCKTEQKKVSVEKPSAFLVDGKRISAIEIRTWLEKITDEDARLMGFNIDLSRPEWSILTTLPIPPVTMRPSITLETGERSEDDLTHKLGDIVRINQRLFENINAGAPEIIIEDLWDLLQYHITTYLDNSVAQLPPARHRNGQPLKTLADRIKSKEGRIRHNLAGKRVNFSARTVVSPDPMIEINEVGVPREVAIKLTVPETVTEWNMEYLKKLIQKGPDAFPGANYVARPDGKRKKISDETKEQLLEELQPGYIVERHLMDGDVALFNRQPSLHRMSMMCHRVKVLPGKTFRINPTVCAPYNADFDGDEMNLHVPQTEEARAEAELLMQVQNHIISPRYGLSIIGMIQDSITGNYFLTKDEKVSRQRAIDLLVAARHFDMSKLPKGDVVKGSDVFSCLLPDDFNFMGKTKQGTNVVIKNGKLVEGFMDSGNLGGGKGLLLRTIHKQYGADEALIIMGKIFRLGIEVVQHKGLTVSISDSDLPQEVKENINDIFKKAEAEIEKLVASYKAGTFEAIPGRSTEDTLEMRIVEILNKARNETGKIVQEGTNVNSGTYNMAISGARGNVIQIAQVGSSVGQQSLGGLRISAGYTGRTLSNFEKGDLTAEARGFIRNGFKTGMKPSEFFFGAMTGRDALMDTALRTPKSGYLYRRLANSMQDVKVEYDQTVRDASGKIIQFKYGEDGVDVSKSEAGKINVKRIIDLVMSS